LEKNTQKSNQNVNENWPHD